VTTATYNICTLLYAHVGDVALCYLGLKCRSNMADFLKKLPMLHDDNYVPNVSRKRPDVSHERDIDELVMP
jgi:hypothetical protein